MVVSDFSFSENTIGYIVEGVMDDHAINELREQILEKFKEHDKINLYLEDNNIQKFSFNAVLIATLFPIEHSGRFNKVAMVTNRKWIHMISSINNSITANNIKNYPIEKRMEAIAWIAG